MKTQKIEKYSEIARENLMNLEGGAHLLCDWVSFVFIHYEVDSELLQKDIPFKLHLYQGKAYVSLVAFTLNNFRYRKEGIVEKLMMAPVKTHRYFNVRTYVKNEKSGEDGIYFIKEWISNGLCSLVASNMYGLPCHQGHLTYRHKLDINELGGVVDAHKKFGIYQYQTKLEENKVATQVEQDTLDEFLVERYIAFVEGKNQKQYFRIWHNPWKLQPLIVEHVNDKLLANIGRWGNDPKLIKAHYSDGVYDVWMGKAQMVK